MNRMLRSGRLRTERWAIDSGMPPGAFSPSGIRRFVGGLAGRFGAFFGRLSSPGGSGRTGRMSDGSK